MSVANPLSVGPRRLQLESTFSSPTQISHNQVCRTHERQPICCSTVQESHFRLRSKRGAILFEVQSDNVSWDKGWSRAEEGNNTARNSNQRLECEEPTCDMEDRGNQKRQKGRQS